MGWSARGAEVPGSPSKGPFLSLCGSLSTAPVLTGGSAERVAGKGLGQDVVSGFHYAQKGGEGEGFHRPPQMQDLLNVKPHPVVSS